MCRSRRGGLSQETYSGCQHCFIIWTNEWIQRALQGQPRISRHAGRGSLGINRVGAWIMRIFLIDVQKLRLSVMILPRPEHTINKRMMEEENRIKRRRVILSHIPVCALDHAR